MQTQRLFEKKLLESEVIASRPDLFAKTQTLPKDLDFTVGIKTPVSCTLKTAQGLQMIGYDQKKIAQTLETVKLLKETAGREIDPVVFAKTKERYNLKLSVMAGLASLCRQDAADLGLVLRSLVRFYKRTHMKESDLEEIERFVEWIVSRGESIKGVQSSWKEFKRIAGRKQ